MSYFVLEAVVLNERSMAGDCAGVEAVESVIALSRVLSWIAATWSRTDR